MALSFSAVSSGDPIDMMKPPTCCSVIRSETRRQLALDVGVKSPKSCGQTSCAALSRADSVAMTESTQLADRDDAGAGALVGEAVLLVCVAHAAASASPVNPID